jgi:hypothetical protein
MRDLSLLEGVTNASGRTNCPHSGQVGQFTYCYRLGAGRYGATIAAATRVAA